MPIHAATCQIYCPWSSLRRAHDLPDARDDPAAVLLGRHPEDRRRRLLGHHAVRPDLDLERRELRHDADAAVLGEDVDVLDFGDGRLAHGPKGLDIHLGKLVARAGVPVDADRQRHPRMDQ